MTTYLDDYGQDFIVDTSKYGVDFQLVYPSTAIGNTTTVKALISQLQAWVKEQEEAGLRAVYSCECGSIRIVQDNGIFGFIPQRTFCMGCNRDLTEEEIAAVRPLNDDNL